MGLDALEEMSVVAIVVLKTRQTLRARPMDLYPVSTTQGNWSTFFMPLGPAVLYP